MIDRATNRRILVSSKGNEAQIVVQANQQLDVEKVLQRAEISYTLAEEGTQSESIPLTNTIKLRDSHALLAQSALDQAAVKVSASLVDGGSLEFFQPQDFIDRFDSLKREGYEGNELVHKLLTDDWGAPPTVILLEGLRADGNTFRELLPYQSRPRRRN